MDELIEKCQLCWDSPAEGTCPSCGGLVCENCQCDDDPENFLCSRCAEEISDMVCDRCGEYSEDVMVCESCGERFCDDCATSEEVETGLCDECLNNLGAG